MSLKVMLKSNLQLKLLSLLLAALIWLFVTAEGVDEIEIPLSVNYINIPPGLVVKPSPAPKQAIRIEGRRILLLRQQLLGATIVLDLAGVREGTTVFSGMERAVKLVQGVRPASQQPLKIELTVMR